MMHPIHSTTDLPIIVRQTRINRVREGTTMVADYRHCPWKHWMIEERATELQGYNQAGA